MLWRSLVFSHFLSKRKYEFQHNNFVYHTDRAASWMGGGTTFPHVCLRLQQEKEVPPPAASTAEGYVEKVVTPRKLLQLNRSNKRNYNVRHPQEVEEHHNSISSL